ncbi:Rho GTPase activation protein [Tricholoma matsutake]|nr:Rho GTPase activation protein [Tricholoma matsutake 945]
MHSYNSTTPPTKASLKAWWNHFTFNQKAKKDSEPRNTDGVVHTVFGKPLGESLRYASVQISTPNTNGELYVWGYIPVVVAKCGLYLKENATEVAGTFRVNGSAKRMRELQAAFEAPPRYGKSLDWSKETYTTHDVASVFRRYLTQMPEPVIPHDMYHNFRDTLAKSNYNQDEIIAKYKRLIREMPEPNQYLLLYVLDLLSVFARKSDKNLMTATNLAVIFRPGFISHPEHEMLPSEHALSQRVLEFLIAQQDWFMLDIPPPPMRRHDALPRTTATEIDDEIVLVPSSVEKIPGWKLGGRDRHKMPRRRTTVDRNDNRGTLTEEDMSPVSESSSEQIGVTRRRTLPSSRRRGDAPEGPFSQGSRVLRKQKRASSSQPSRYGKPETPPS